MVLSTFTQDDDSQETMDVFRLPNITKPESYDLHIIPNLNGLNSTYSGYVKIVIVANTPTDIVTINVKELHITEVTFSEFDRQPCKEIKVIEKISVPKNEQFVIKLETALIPDSKYLLTISFRSSIRTDDTGFFLSSYVENKVIKYVQVTSRQRIYFKIKKL